MSNLAEKSVILVKNIKEFTISYMRIVLLVIFCLFVPRFSMGQDEKFFRKLFSGELIKVNETQIEKKYNYIFHSPEYAIDLNDDKKFESIVYVKRDSEDWIDIYNSYKELVFKYRFEEKGVNSGLYKIVRKKLSKNTMLLMLYYYEGETKYIDFESSARIYFLTIDNLDLKNIHVEKGPSIFEEQKTLKAHYHIRNYQVAAVDLDNDNTREIVVKHRGMSDVFVYKGNGHWKTYRTTQL